MAHFTCLVELGRGSPHFRPAREMLRAVFPFESKFASPQAPSLSFPFVIIRVPWSLCPSAQLRAQEDVEAHLVHCAQEKAGRELPALPPEKARSNLAKVKQSQGEAEVRRLSSLQALWTLSPLILRGTVAERGKLEPDGWRTCPGSPGLLFPSPAWKGRAEIPNTGGF